MKVRGVVWWWAEMSLADTRTALRDALATVDGVNALLRPPTTIANGQAWPQFDGATLSGVPYGIAGWTVWAVAGSTQTAAETWLDEHAEDVLAALRPVLAVDTVTPVAIGDTGLIGVQFAGRKEFP